VFCVSPDEESFLAVFGVPPPPPFDRLNMSSNAGVYDRLTIGGEDALAASPPSGGGGEPILRDDDNDDFIYDGFLRFWFSNEKKKGPQKVHIFLSFLQKLFAYGTNTRTHGRARARAR